MFIRKRIEYITIKEMNNHLKFCREYRKIIDGPKPKNETFGLRAYVEDKQVYFKLSYKVGSKACTYICRKDAEECTQTCNGMEAYSILQKYYKCPDLREDTTLCRTLKYNEDAGKFLLSAKPLLWKNERYENTRNNAIGYDINSSYSYAMLKDMPDTTKKYRMGTVKKNEIGFKEDSEGNFIPVFEGHFSLWIFPIMKSPFTKFVDNWYNKKKHAKTKLEKQKAKDVLNLSVGYLQRTNPFIRATIIYYANLEISKLIDENTLYCNTDSLVSMVERDLNIGKDIGQFKIEHTGKFAFTGFNYQWNLEVPSYRHISKSWFKEGFDILKDRVPSNGNIVHYEDFKLKEIKYESKKTKK